MDIGLLLVVLGIVLAVLVSYQLGVLLLVLGIVLLLVPYARR